MIETVNHKASRALANPSPAVRQTSGYNQDAISYLRFKVVNWIS
jgi:hypothetical protein